MDSADIPELHASASWPGKDWAAVTAAGLTLPWSSGRIGHVNRMKMLKRQMYGRAILDLLGRRDLAGDA